MGLTCVYPLDTVKTRLQLKPDKYRSAIDCVQIISRNEGLASLYRGLAAPVLGYGLMNATAFSSNSAAKRLLGGESADPSKLNIGVQMAAGGMAGFAQSFVRAPFEQIKVVMQASNKEGCPKTFKNSFECVKYVVRHEGVGHGLFRSLTPTIMREVPQYAITYPSYEFSKRTFNNLAGGPSTWTMMAAGACAGAAQWIPTYPMDVIKTRMSNARLGQYSGVVDCVIQSYKNEGAMVFWRGLTPAVARAMPLHAVVFVFYEFTLDLLQGASSEPGELLLLPKKQVA